MSEFKGDYMGFTYNGVHSSVLGIVRISDGSRFNENLLPTIQDKTVQVPGGDGTYYFGSYYTQRQFSVSFAFDSLTEEQVARLKSHFGDKQIHDLIFDEAPYKVYSAKVTGTATLKHIPFDEGTTGRAYKGEGTIQFMCYWPFARCRYKTKERYYEIPEYAGLTEAEKELRIDEWWAASRIDNGGNFGDIPAHFKKTISGDDKDQEVQFGDEYVNWEKMPKNCYGELDTKTGLVFELELNTETGLMSKNQNILNEHLTGISTLKIPVGATTKETEGLTFDCWYI